ncbi:osmotically inducible protein C [Anopheles sinensis]|uniref:Osmotically inducible protein C n=1 Tax=Anopheles sinensis TaxID=74873 RepID=A0A084WPM0_ANOSI|nr:osmotically inducible protein C [Anopheles sinensis]
MVRGRKQTKLDDPNKHKPERCDLLLLPVAASGLLENTAARCQTVTERCGSLDNICTVLRKGRNGTYVCHIQICRYNRVRCISKT